MKYVKRKGRVYVICKKNPRHKQRQGYHTVSEAFRPTYTPSSTYQGIFKYGVIVIRIESYTW